MSTTDRPTLIQLTPAAARGELRMLGQQPGLAPEDRARLERRAKLFAWRGNAWHLVEFAVALAAGIAAGSVALVGFGLDSLIEVAAAGVVIWLFSGGREAPGRQDAELLCATVSEAGQNMICAYLSVALLVGLLLNALAGWWWADPAAALVIAALAGKEGIESWRGESCECC
jgi:divalent metal cation (Fe/Co/Zn/Cd) transporter